VSVLAIPKRARRRQRRVRRENGDGCLCLVFFDRVEHRVGAVLAADDEDAALHAALRRGRAMISPRRDAGDVEGGPNTGSARIGLKALHVERRAQRALVEREKGSPISARCKGKKAFLSNFS
jgi:hypothetical protein